MDYDTWRKSTWRTYPPEVRALVQDTVRRASFTYRWCLFIAAAGWASYAIGPVIAAAGVIYVLDVCLFIIWLRLRGV